MKYTITMFADFLDPFCYIGKGMIDNLAKEYDIELHIKGFEIHPDIPEEGVKTTEYLPDAAKQADTIKECTDTFGLGYKQLTIMPNTNKALQVLEYAKTVDKDQAYATAVFEAVFKDGINVGSLEELKKIANSVGISADEVDKVLATDEYKSILTHNVLFCSVNGFEMVPTFIINEKMAIPGLREPDVFRKTFAKLAAH